MAKAPSKPTQRTVKKTAVKKPAVKTTATKKKIAAPKPASKPTVKAKKRVTVKKRVTTKSASKKPAEKKFAVKKSVKPARGNLQAKLDSVAQRLTSAQTQTKKNITALETDFEALAKQMGRTKAGQTRLTRRVTELSKTLAKDLVAAQTEIRGDLANVLQNPTLNGLQAALDRAENRLQESETAQETAIARINRHISEIATIVDRRLSEEQQARVSAMAEMKREMTAGQTRILAAQAALEKTQTTHVTAMQLRVSDLQSESAEAIRSLGDKLVDVAEEMGRRRDVMGAGLRQDLNEATLTANTEFEQFRRVVERRLEALESDLRSVDSQIERSLAPLSSRIEGLEYGLSQAPQPVQDYAPNLQAVPPLAPSPLAAPVTQADAVQPVPFEADAFSPAPQPAYPVTQEAPLELTEPAAAKAVPYDPQAYVQTPAVQAPPAAQAPYADTALAANPYGAATAQPQAYDPAPMPAPMPTTAPLAYAPETAYSHTQPPFPQTVAPQIDELPVLDGDLPYADPAYAEGQFGNPNQSDDSMGAARPGAFKNLKKIGRKARNSGGDESTGLSALMTPRNLKLGGLVAALGLASVIGVQTLAPKVPSASGEFSVAENAALDGQTMPEGRPSLGGADGQILAPTGAARGTPPAGLMTADGTPIAPNIEQPTIGQYADNRKMAMAEGGESALSAAVQAGNPVAQLQLGLSKLESGELESGVKLIRASANQDQPAALYRLAKLYETGQGVGQDAATARQLTERAARGGNRIAMHDLALYFAEGRGGVDIDMPKAAKWFEKAAERGVVDSQFNLGVLFESGQGLPQNMENALVWYSIAGAQGDQMAAGRVGVLRKTLPEAEVERADNRIAAFTPSRIDEEANGIFNNVPWAKPSQVASNDATKAGVIQTQTLLNELGYTVGAADGAIGPKTKTAIMDFQRVNGLDPTGVVNAELIERLESAAGA